MSIKTGSTNPRFPIFIPSKGRSDTRLTMRVFDRMRVPYRVIVEEQQFNDYAAAVGAARLLVLDRAYQRDYEPLDGLADTISKGSGPARNFAWDCAVAEGAEFHWVIDDNIRIFYRLNNNRKTPLADGTAFLCMEDFVLRYKNVAMACPNYQYFAKHRQSLKPIILNTRAFSCNLINTGTPFRWRGRYNEDLDLSLRMLKAGWCTVQFNAFLQDKITTQAMAGGNTTELYAKYGTLPKSRMIVDAHPDVASLVWKFKRWHHHVDYRPFARNKLIRRDGVDIATEPNEYGMRLVQLSGKEESNVAEKRKTGTTRRAGTRKDRRSAVPAHA